ncbi:MAG: hypothetical protein ACO35Q_09150, partial [Prochlorothrix sp.]
RQSGIADLQSASSSSESPTRIANLGSPICNRPLPPPLRSPAGIANLGSPICNRPLPLQNRQSAIAN